MCKSELWKKSLSCLWRYRSHQQLNDSQSQKKWGHAESVDSESEEVREMSILNDEQKEKDDKGKDVIREKKGIRESKGEYIFKSIHSFNCDWEIKQDNQKQNQ